MFNETETMIRETAARFAADTLAVRAAELDKTSDEKLYVDNLRQLAALGFNGLCVSEKYGGVNAGAVAYALAMMELGGGCAATAAGISVTNMVAEIVQRFGGEAVKSEFLPPLMRGDWPAASFCLTEAAAGSDPSAMRTTAVADGDYFVLNGVKQWITSGAIAGFYVVWAKTAPEVPRGKGITCFLVAADTAGVSAGPAADKMGQRASPTNDIIFNNARVPSSHILGGLNDGYRIAMQELFGGRIGIGAMALGIASAALKAARDYMLEREQHGKKLAQHQGLQWMLAERQAEVEAGFWLLIRAAQLKDAGQSYTKEAAMAKLFASQTGERATRDALQIFGGYGYIRDFPLERYCRDIRITSIYEGTSEMQKLIIARELLRD